MWPSNLFADFTLANRIEVDLNDLGFIVLPQLLAQGEAFAKEKEELKTQRKRALVEAKSNIKGVELPPRLRDPW